MSLARFIVPFMRGRVGALLLLAVALGACASTLSSLPYQPAVKPPGATVSAAYTGIGSFGRVGGGVSTGVGVLTGTTVGGGSSGNATAIASFPLAQAGPARGGCGSRSRAWSRPTSWWASSKDLRTSGRSRSAAFFQLFERARPIFS